MFLALGAFLRADDRPKRDMLTRSVRPEDLEMPLSGFSDYLTPAEHFFVRAHVYVPAVNIALNPSDWRLNVGGSVTTPLTLTLDDLKKLPAAEIVSVLECAGADVRASADVRQIGADHPLGSTHRLK